MFDTHWHQVAGKDCPICHGASPFWEFQEHSHFIQDPEVIKALNLIFWFLILGYPRAKEELCPWGSPPHTQFLQRAREYINTCYEVHHPELQGYYKHSGLAQDCREFLNLPCLKESKESNG